MRAHPRNSRNPRLMNFQPEFQNYAPYRNRHIMRLNEGGFFDDVSISCFNVLPGRGHRHRVVTGFFPWPGASEDLDAPAHTGRSAGDPGNVELCHDYAA